jgi:hypothetical protein
MIEAPWSEIKRIADAKGIPMQWVQVGDNYHIALVDGLFTLYCLLPLAVDNVATNVFEASYKAAGNKSIALKQTALVNPESYRFRGNATPWINCAPGTTNLDIMPSATEVRYVDGGIIVTKDANPGDYCSFQVVHPTYGVVETYVPKWFVTPGTGQQLIQVYPASIPAGITLRVVYTNSGSSDVGVGVNYRLHRVGTGT